MPYKKLIETGMPVSVINRESEREKTARSGMPGGIHIWWSRRPMAAARSTLFASLVDDPAGHPELFPLKEDQNRERARLMKLAEELAAVENASSHELLEAAKTEILRYTEGAPPVVFDPFAGGGSIPVEAQRLGLKTEASDLNPVAVMITKLITDVPSRFRNMAPVHPREETNLNIPFSGAKGFAEDVQYYGERIQAAAKEQIGHLYPKVISPESGRDVEVSAWIWARTVKCPNPSCGCEIPLFSSYDLAKKKGSEAWVEPFVDGSKVCFRVHRGPNTSADRRPKVAQTAVFKCPACGEITPDAYVKECGVNRQIRSQLIAVVADDGKRRLYLEASPEQESGADVPAPAEVPHGALPDFPRRFAPPAFGLTDYADLFTSRQLIFLTTMMRLAREIQGDVERHGAERGLPDDGISFSAGGRGALAYAEAVRLALALTVSRLIDRCSNICSWDSSGGGSLRNVFSRAAMPMIWDYAEGNPFGAASGSFSNALSRVREVIAELPAGVSGSTTVRDGREPSGVRGVMMSTELPFYDRAGYADLSDIFYVWLRYGLGDLYPDCFQTEVTPKKEELTAFSYRWNGDRQKANACYAEGIGLAMRSACESVTESCPSTVAFRYGSGDGKADGPVSEWETFVTAVCEAGFMITASWPLGRKYSEGVERSESKDIPITVVIRKRPADAPQTTRRFFVAAVKRELPEIVRELNRKVGLVDLRASAVGRALEIYSRHSRVLDADGAVMSPWTAARIIEQELDTILNVLYQTQQA